jgi:DEAD/DEAH box helicase domain-containing protein
MTQSSVEQVSMIQTETSGNVDYSLVGIRVTDAMLAYKQKTVDGDRTLDVIDLSHLNFPPQTFETLAVRLDFPSQSPLESKGEDPFEYPGALHGVEHAMIAVAPLVAGCDRNDLGSAWYTVSPDTLCPCIFIFDRTPGGVGLAEQLRETFAYWREAALNLLESCPCLEGCPGCLLSSRCEAANEHLDKKGAIALLRMI